MWDWSNRGIEALLNDAQQIALERLSGGLGSDLEGAMIEQMNLEVAGSERALDRLLDDLLLRTRSPVLTIGRRVPVPARTPIPEDFVRAAAGPPPTPPVAEDFQSAAPSLLGRLLGGTMGSAPAQGGPKNPALEDALEEYEREMERWKARLWSIQARLEQEQNRRIAEAERRNAEVAAAEEKLASGPLQNLQTPIVEVVTEMLQPKEADPLRVPLPRSISIQLDPADPRVLIEARVPGLEVVPPREFAPTGDLFPRAVPRSDEQATELYRRYLAALALAVLNAVYTADVGGQLRMAAFNGFVRGAPRGPQHERESYVVSLEATRQQIETARISRSDPREAVDRIGGRITRDAIVMSTVAPVTTARGGR